MSLINKYLPFRSTRDLFAHIKHLEKELEVLKSYSNHAFPDGPLETKSDQAMDEHISNPLHALGTMRRIGWDYAQYKAIKRYSRSSSRIF